MNEYTNIKSKINLYSNLTKKRVDFEFLDCREMGKFENIFKNFLPDHVIHFAEQASAPYSMMSYENAKRTLDNNIQSTFNLIWNVIKYKPECHIIKLGTMGEYGTPNIDIEEGWIDISHKGRNHKFLYPRQGASLYHTSKILDTDLLWFYVRLAKLKVTDLMQGPVYGTETDQSALHENLQPHFHYDDIFGTVLNRFIVQAVMEIPLSIYGKGGQTRGYINIRDAIKCIKIAIDKPASSGELNIVNQFTELFTVRELAELVKVAASKINLNLKINNIPNPRVELEDHYYNVVHKSLKEKGLKPIKLSEEMIIQFIEHIMKYKSKIDVEKILPRVQWNSSN